MRLSKYLPRPTVYLPKYVCLNNPRLAIVYHVLFLVTMGTALYQFTAQQRYFGFKEIRGQVSIDALQLRRPTPQLEEDMATDLKSTVCQPVPQPHNYVTGPFNLTNISCAGLCGQPGVAQPCVVPNELFFLETGNRIFLPSFFTEHWDGPGARPDSHRFVPGLGAAPIAFTHRYFVEEPSNHLANGIPKFSGASTTSPGESADSAEILPETTWLTRKHGPILTVMLNEDGSEERRFQPGEPIIMDVGFILNHTRLVEFTGKWARLHLDDLYRRSNVGIVHIPGTGVTVRLTGMSLTINLQYSNINRCDLDGRPIYIKKWVGDVCCMTIVGSRNWEVHQIRSVLKFYPDTGAVTTKTREYHGIRVSFTSQGTFAEINAPSMFDGLTMLLIWSQIPMYVVYYFVIIVLGKLSHIYYRVLHQSISIGEACAGMAARLVSYSSSFLDFCDEKNYGLGRDQMLQRLRVVLCKSKDLDDGEIKMLVNFIHAGMLKKSRDSGKSGNVDMEAFCSACASNEPLSFASLVTVFDQDRKLGLMERLFGDQTISAIRKCKRVFNDELYKESHEVDTGKSTRAGQARHHSNLEMLVSTNRKQAAAFERIRHKFVTTLGLSAETLDKEEEHLFELRRQDLASRGKPEMRPPVKLSSGATYHGDWIGNTRHGYGVETWPDGSTYEGTWEAGRVHGHAIFRQPNGAKYEGQWKCGRQHGAGIHISDNGAKYEGQFQHGMKNGQGTIFLTDGSTYKGEIVDNMMHGPGEYEWIDGKSFTGEWSNNLMHGHGVYQYVEGGMHKGTYEGQYQNNAKNGHGIFRWAEGKTYEGQYLHNKRSGTGVFTMPDGTKITGTWKDGKQHGPGSVTAPNGRVRAARWDMGVLVQS